MPAIEIATESALTTPTEIAVGGLLFDMDGVLVRSTHGDERCWTRWAAHHGLSEIFDLRRTHGRRAVDTIREHLPDLTVDLIAEHLAQLDSFAEEEQSDVIAYPGVVELLALLPSYRWAVVTSATEKMMRSWLAAAGIPTPTHTVGGDAVSMGKPHPEGYLRGAGILTRQPQECLVIEDAPAGVRAGKAAGCQVLAVASSHRPSELQEANGIIASIDQIAVSVDTKLQHSTSNSLRCESDSSVVFACIASRTSVCSHLYRLQKIPPRCCQCTA